MPVTDSIRHVRPEDEDLFAKKLKETSARLYASRTWLRRYGHPRTPADLATAVFVGSADASGYIAALASKGCTVAADQFKIITESGVVGWEMIKRGLAVGAMLDEVAALTPDVEQLLPQVPPFSVPYWLCTHRELQTSRRIRLVFDLLAEELR